MNSVIFETVSYAMRYWFIAVVAVVLIALIYISYKEYNEKKYVKDTMSKFLGYLEIIGGPEEFIGDRFGVRDQNTIGSSRKSDIMLPDDTVLKTHALLYKEGEDIVISPTSSSDTKINGRRASTKHRLKTGDVISIGDVDFALYLKRTRISHDD